MTRYLKDKRTGFVMDADANLNHYIQERNRVKSLVKTKNELKESKNEVSALRSEVKEIKELLQQLLSKED